MANLSTTETFDDVYRIDELDPVLGWDGVSIGPANDPHQALANRTAYLKKHVDDMESGASVPGGAAPKNSPVFTGDPQAPTPPLGDNDQSISTTAFVQGSLSLATKSVVGGVNVTLTPVEAGAGILEFTGALTANIAVIVPAVPKRSWIAVNKTSGAFTLTVRTSSGTGKAVTQNKARLIRSDGINVVDGHDDYESIAMTGVPTAPTAPSGTNTTQVATCAHVKAATPDASTTAKGLAEFATLTETKDGVSQSLAVTPYGLAGSVVGGEGAKWRDVSGSRVAGTSYQNTSNRPRMVSVQYGNNASFECSEDNNIWVWVAHSYVASVSFIVPPGHYYRLATGDFQHWSELY